MFNDDGLGIAMQISAIEGSVKRQKDNYNSAYKDAVRLACILHAKHYPELKDWRPLDDLRGVISQIDNLTCGLVKDPPK